MAAGRPLGSAARRPTVLVLDELHDGLNDLRLELRAEDLDLADAGVEFTAPLAVDLTVGRALQTFSVSGAVAAPIRGECCRCLAPATTRLGAEIRFLLQRRPASDDELEAVAEETDVDLVDPGAKVFDLAERLHDAVALELPLRLYCRPDCRGLCPQCGADLNAGDCACQSRQVDPRWEALAQLKR